MVGRTDLGGAILDLGGGIYSISSTLLIKPGFSNFRIQRGSLIARFNFTSSSGYLLQIGSNHDCNSTSGGQNNKNCNSDVSLQDLTLDAQNVAFGGLLVEETMECVFVCGINRNVSTGNLMFVVTCCARLHLHRILLNSVNVGPNIYVEGFQGVGISLAGSGAGYIHEAWLGQYAPGKKHQGNLTATAILLAGAQHDCDVNNVIIWSGLVGVNSSNGANRLQGVHTWNLAGSKGGYKVYFT